MSNGFIMGQRKRYVKFRKEKKITHILFDGYAHSVDIILCLFNLFILFKI